MSRVPITVCIIAKNEEKFIDKCLSQLKPYGFEIIVTDTGSTDKTVEIAQKYADKVLHFEWINDFSKARNYCASFASNDWIFSLDCDEHLVKIDVNSLVKQLEENENKIGVIPLKNYVRNFDGSVEFHETNINRIYNKKKFHFVSTIHEQIVSILADERSVERFYVDMDIIHYGYMLDPKETEIKQYRNLELLLGELEKNPKDSYINFQIGQAYFFLEEFDKAIAFYQNAYVFDQDLRSEYMRENIYWLTISYIRNGEEKKALNFIQQFNERLVTAKLVYCYALALYFNDEYLKAQVFFLKTTLMPDFETLNANCKHCYEYIIQLYEAMSDLQMADVFRQKLLECDDTIKKINAMQGEESDAPTTN